MNTKWFFLANTVLGIGILGVCAYVLRTLKKIQSLRTELDIHSEHSNLEDVLSAITTKIKRLDSNGQRLQEELRALNTFARQNLRGVGIHKFNAFPDEGGNLSFSLALLDDHLSGFVINSIHGRSNNRIYIKSITNGSGNKELTAEERAAILATGIIVNNRPTN